MAGRPVQEKADIQALKKLTKNISNLIDTQPVIAYIMRSSGCTYAEIAKVFGVTRQMAETIVKNAEQNL